MIALERILEKHRETTDRTSLKYSLGDGYLISKNPIYRSIRHFGNSEGIRFTRNRFADSDVLPLGALKSILQKKTVPYRDNVSPLMKLARTSVRYGLLPEFSLVNSNYILHESAHICANQVLKGPRSVGGRKSLLTAERGVALRSLIGESYANAIELVAGMYATDPLHAFFFRCNTHVAIADKPPIRLREISEDYALALFSIVTLSFLYSNFLYQRLDSSDFNRSWAFLDSHMVPMREKFSAKQMRFLRSAFRWGLSQAPNFKFYGAEFYFKQIGLQSRFSSLMRFDFLNMLEQDLSARDGFVFLCNLAVGRKEG